jgi:CO/xanthine dehydrogenase Mo-binding subunit
MGGAAQGLGGILFEGIAYDANGQLLSGSLMDYALPTASVAAHIRAIIRSDAPTLFSSGAHRRLRTTRIRSASLQVRWP